MRPFVGTAEDVAAAMAGELGACADLEHDVLAARAAVAQAARTRGFVKVQDGCDCHCAYCIIPTVRGSARSRPASAVLDEVRRRVAQGQPEMVMTGISVGDYRDPERGLELGELMVEVAQVPGVRARAAVERRGDPRQGLACSRRSRPSPRSARTCTCRCSPATTACCATWAATTRPRSTSTRSRALRAAVPHVNVTTDVIVGFPTEDDGAFERTLQAIDAAGHHAASTRSPTRRAREPSPTALGDRVPPEEKKRRSRELRGHAEVRSRHHRAAKLGGGERVLIDKVAEHAVLGLHRGLHPLLPAGRRRATAGEVVDVRCVELHADGIACEPRRTSAGLS